jgi:hypothetical protein
VSADPTIPWDGNADAPPKLPVKPVEQTPETPDQQSDDGPWYAPLVATGIAGGTMIGVGGAYYGVAELLGAREAQVAHEVSELLMDIDELTSQELAGRRTDERLKEYIEASATDFSEEEVADLIREFYNGEIKSAYRWSHSHN